MRTAETARGSNTPQGAIGYLLARQPSAHATILIGAVVGLIVGTLYGWQEKRSRICCADAKILAGLLAGIAASLFALILGLLFEELVYPKSAMAIAPIAILVYVTATPWFVRRCQLIVPAAVDGAIVGLGVGGNDRVPVYADGRVARSRYAAGHRSLASDGTCAGSLAADSDWHRGELWRGRRDAFAVAGALVRSLSKTPESLAFPSLFSFFG